MLRVRSSRSDSSSPGSHVPALCAYFHRVFTRFPMNCDLHVLYSAREKWDFTNARLYISKENPPPIRYDSLNEDKQNGLHVRF